MAQPFAAPISHTVVEHLKPAMNSDANREEQVFEAALQFPTPDQRAAYVKGACGNDEKLRQRVEALLKAHEHEGGFLDQPPAVMSSKTLVLTTGMMAVTEKPGDKIGRYKVLQQIGEGGCGVVYMAEQEEPVRRRVALKVIKLGMDTKSVIARFEAERQALALMDHPNIAKVLDAGATGDDRGADFSPQERPQRETRGTEGRPFADREIRRTEVRAPDLQRVGRRSRA